MTEVWQHARRCIESNIPATLVMVVHHEGSVPGPTGACLVASHTRLVGTIGGGVAEKTLVDQALGRGGAPTLATFRHTEADGGTLCSGTQTFAIVPLAARDLTTIATIADDLAHARSGTLTLTPSGIDYRAGEVLPRCFVDGGEGWSFTEPIGLLDTLYIVGGGHVSLALSRIMVTLPFRVVVLDNRPDLPTMVGNRFAHEKRIIDFREVDNEIPNDLRSWIVIMTFGHEHDRQVLERLLGRNNAYLGLMGSQSKIRKMFADLKGAGVSKEDLDAVHAPVGVPIASHTPEEIAISIAAEIVGKRNCMLHP